MIKYVIIKYTPDGYGGNLSELKTIKKYELDEYLNNGWHILEKIIPIITPLKKWWNEFSTSHKIAIITFIIPSFFGGLGWILDKVFDNKYYELKNHYEELNEKYNQNIQTLILTSDSLKIERENSERLLQELKAKKVFYINQNLKTE
jgi:hypothetical protein